jgi:hypothetical protein
MKAVVASVDVNAERLAGFLIAAGPLLRLPVSPTSALPSAERLGRIVKALRPHLEQSRTKGRHLNVWAVAGLKKDEVRNAAVLATLLDPQQLGGLSRAFLANILEEVGLGSPAFAAIDVMEPYSVMTEACLRRGNQRESAASIRMRMPSA